MKGRQCVTGILAVATLFACADDETGSSGGTPAPSAGGVDAAAIAACPRSDTLLTTADWITCLSGRSVTGTEPFGGARCELRAGEGGAFTYVRNGAAALSVPPRSSWGAAAFGTYQNGNDTMIAGISPDLPLVPGGATLQKLRLLFAGRGVEDTIEIEYLDASRARGTYACRVDVL